MFILTNLSLLIANTFLNNMLPAGKLKMGVQAAFGGLMFLLTWIAANKITATNQFKKKYGYKFAANDLQLDSKRKIFRVALTSMIAGILCGTAGIAPGNVLAPLFLSYNMIP